MTVVLAVLLAVALSAAVVLAFVARVRARAARAAEARASDAAEVLSRATAASERAEQEKRAAEVRAGAAEGRARSAEQKAFDAERRAGDAERRIGDVMRRAEEAERAGARSGAALAVWELEQLRVGREWLDVAGPGADPPIPWDGTVAPVVATELSVIREVMGTPSELTIGDPAVPSSPDQAAVAARVIVEMLRVLARSGAEMDVRLEAGTLTVAQEVYPGERAPDLDRLAEVAASAGLGLAVEVTESRAVVRLTVA